MTWASRYWGLAVVSGATQIIVIWLAFWLGWSAKFFDAMSVLLLTSAAGLLLLGLGAFLRPTTEGRRRSRAALFLFCYALVLFLLNAPWLVAESWWGTYTFLTLLVPFAVGVAAFPRRGEWLATGGAVLFVFASVFALVYNLTHGMSGVSYWNGWLD
jgi:hypothetical protein